MTTLEILKAARELISVPERWTQASYARNKAHTPVDWLDSSACSWCAMGAIAKASFLEKDQVLAQQNAIDQLKNFQFHLAEFNDAAGTKHTDILALFDRAIARLESEAR